MTRRVRTHEATPAYFPSNVPNTYYIDGGFNARLQATWELVKLILEYYVFNKNLKYDINKQGKQIMTISHDIAKSFILPPPLI